MFYGEDLVDFEVRNLFLVGCIIEDLVMGLVVVLIGVYFWV